MTKEFRGHFLFLEHRFFNFSVNSTNSISEAQIPFLSVDQALEDVHRFIEYARRDLVRDRNAKVILMGWQYGGSLAAWYHQRYPKVASGLWASSAPMLAKVNYTSWMGVVDTMIRQDGGDDCYQRLSYAFKRFDELYARDDVAGLQEEFLFCNATAPDFETRIVPGLYANSFGVDAALRK